LIAADTIAGGKYFAGNKCDVMAIRFCFAVDSQGYGFNSNASMKFRVNALDSRWIG